MVTVSGEALVAPRLACGVAAAAYSRDSLGLALLQNQRVPSTLWDAAQPELLGTEQHLLPVGTGRKVALYVLL